MKVLNKFEFKAGVGAQSTYEWDKILSGKIIQLEDGVDYNCKTQTFRMMATKQAHKRGLGIRINVVEGGLVVQTYEASKDQLAKWEEQEEQAKEKAKQRRAEKAEEE